MPAPHSSESSAEQIATDQSSLSDGRTSAARSGLIYVPGLDGTGKLLHRQPGLHSAYNVRCISYPQHQPATYAELAALAARELEQVGPGVVLAESFGGAVALTLALSRPELVQRLVLVNTFAYFPSRWKIRLASWAGRLFPARPSHPATRGIRGPFFFNHDIPPAERAAFWEQTNGVPMSAMGHRLRLIADVDLRPFLPSIRIPTLVLASPNDRVVSPQAGRELARLIPAARLIELNVGHTALIHPTVDIAKLLADPSYWPLTR